MFPFGRIPFNFPFLKKDGSISTIGDEINAGGGGGYTLPTASDETLGGVKVGSGLSIDTNGVLSSDGGGFSPTTSVITVNTAMSTPTTNVLYKFANMVFMGFIGSISASGAVKYVALGTLPEGYRPAESISIPCHVVSGSSTHLNAYMTIGTNGNINVVLPSDLYNSEHNYGFNKVMVSAIFSI